MKKVYLNTFISRVFIFIFCGITSVLSLNAQTVVISTGTAGTPQYNAGPIYRSAASSAYDASRYAYLYTADELAAVGITTGAMINGVGWAKNNNATTTGPGAIFRVYLKNSTATTFSQASETWANLNSGAQMVYENTNQTIPATTAPDYIPFNFATPFIYTGGSLEVSTEWDCNAIAGNATTGTFEWLWSTVVDKIYGTGQTVLGNAGTLSAIDNSISDINDRRPFLQISFTPGGPCTNPPTAGTITSSAANVCLGIPFTMSYTGGTNGTGQTFQWQSSPDGTTWTDIPGANTLFLNTSQTASTTYRLNITCGATVSSNIITVNTPAAVQGVFTIDRLSPASPTNFQSFNEAYNYISCGISGNVTFNVLNGPYNEQLIMSEVPGAGPAATVTFNGNNQAITFASSNSNERAVIKLNGADYINFNDLVVNAAGRTASQYGFGFQLMNDANNNMINGCTINIDPSETSTNYAGIVISGSATSATGTGTVLCDDNIITNNNITGGYYGITLVGSSTEANRNNFIVGNNITDTYFYGIYVLGSFNTLIEGNNIERPSRNVVSTFYGIYFTGLSVSAEISKNRISNPFGGDNSATGDFYGIYFTGNDGFAGMENRIINNLIYNLTGNGNVVGIYNSSSDNVFIYHNTISLDGTAALAASSSYARGFYQITQAAGIVFKNNLISITRGGPGVKYGLYFGTAGSEITSDYNNIFIGSGISNAHTGYINATNQTSLAAWQTSSLQDSHSVVIDPIFAGSIAGNFLPTNASMNDLGTPLGVLSDIMNVTRSATTPDMGAYEFTPLPCVAPPTAGTVIFSDNEVCEFALVTLGALNGSTGLGQTYQWQSAQSMAGPWVNVGGVLTNPTLTISASVSSFYRLQVDCGGSVVNSTPGILMVNPAFPAGTYTINSLIPTGGNNFASFNEAYAALECGIAGPVVFEVESGTGPYYEQLIMGPIGNASAINTVTFKGNGNTLRYEPTVSAERAVIKFDGTDHVIIDSLVIDASGPAATYGYGVQMLNNADSNTISRCIINLPANSTSLNFAGIVISSSATSATQSGSTLCDGNRILNNTINSGYYGITLVGSSSDPIVGNEIVGNKVRDFYFYGLYLSYLGPTLVEKNDISRPVRTTLSTYYGIYCLGVSSGVQISKNRMHNPFSADRTSTAAFYGMYFSSFDGSFGAENVVSNNLWYNVDGEGIQYGIYNSASDYIKYYHNTIALEDESSNSVSTTRAFYQLTTAEGIELKNNIFTIKRGGTGTKHVVYYGTTGTPIISNHNLFFIVPGPQHYIGYSSAVNRLSLADWQAATTQDAASMSEDPIYANVLMNDYTPTFAPIDNLGEPVGILTDINDQTRSTTTPDVGAFEFTVPPCVVPPNPGTATIAPSTGICIGTTVVLNLTGNTVGGGQTYQWQSATSAAGPWNDLGPVLLTPGYTTQVTTQTFFRAVVTCNGNSSTSPVVSVTLNAYLPEGEYTINPAGPNTLPNFQSFTDAVTAMNCGIGGLVKFFVVPGTYNEQITINPIGNSSETHRAIFLSQNGDPTSVTLSFDATSSPNPHTLKLNGASFVTFANMSIAATGTTAGRAVEFAGDATSDSIYNCRISAPVVTSTSNNAAGIFGTSLRGGDLTIKNNTITGGYAGIALAGSSAGLLVEKAWIDSNTINNFYQYGIYASFVKRLEGIANTIEVKGPGASSIYGIYCSNADTAMNVSHNRIELTNNTSSAYGMYFTACDATNLERSKIIANKIIGINQNSTTIYGLYSSATTNADIINNVVNVATQGGSTAYGTYSTSGSGSNFWNNSIQNGSDIGSGTANVAAYFTQTASGGNGPIDIRNNIFYHAKNGIALSFGNVSFIYSDYNFLYTGGPTLVRSVSTNLASLQAWINSAFWDVNSIVYPPTFTNNVDMEPDITSPEVWAMHGRGVQIVGNDKDFNDQPRPTTLTTGVPDMGAFEFLPTSLPTLLNGIPATPAPGATQVFMYGTDTVTKVTYAAGSAVPTNLQMRRYSGVIPPALATGQASTYFYTEATVTGAQPADADVKQFYIDPWQGFIPRENLIKYGRTDAANAWQVNAASTVDEIANFFTDNNLNYLDKITGLTDGTVPPEPPTILPPADSSNQGTKFWVGYGHHQGFESGNAQDMILYFSAEQPANVTVRINGTSYLREYQVPAFSVITSEIIPKTGMFDARMLIDGKSTKGIEILSDVPIVAYAHIYASTTSEASLLFPVSTYGYEYTALTTKQNYATNTYSWAYVIAAYDSTKIEITPSNPTLSGNAAGVPFVVTLNEGEMYQVLGALLAPSSSDGYDMTGTTFKSLSNSQGRCLPIAVFSGSSRTNIGCGTSSPSASGDNILEQNFPYSAWGKKYLIAPTSNSSSASSFHTNIFRIAIKDPTTVVTRNGVALTGLINNFFYQFESNTADVIEADQPIMVAQIMASAGYCPNTSGGGDPSMIYVSPVEQGIKRVGLYRNTKSAITTQYLTLIVPTPGLTSLLIDNSNTFDYTYAHSQPGYTVVVKRWAPATNAQVIVSCDSAFTAITYGLGSVESYGYNAGTLIRNLNGYPSFVNTLGSASTSDYTCANTPFNISVLINREPTRLVWSLSDVPQLSPNTDVEQIDPVASGTTIINGNIYYEYELPGTYTISEPGIYVVPIFVSHPDIEGCNDRVEISLAIEVKPAPVASIEFTSGCFGDPITFTGPSEGNGVPVHTWTWDFGNSETATTQAHTLTYATPGTYTVSLAVVTNDGCFGDSTVVLGINERPTVSVVNPSLTVCDGSSATFEVDNPSAAFVYNWYNAETGGTLVHTGPTFTTTATVATSYWVEVVSGSCKGDSRVHVEILPGTSLSVALVQNSFELCNPGAVTFEVQSPVTGATYNWYDAASGGTLVNTGTTFNLPNVTASTTYYVDGQSGTCGAGPRVAATVTLLPPLSLSLIEDTLAVCGTGDVTFGIANPNAGYTYNWYNVATGGTPVHTGTSYQITGITAQMEFWVEATSGACSSEPRVHGVVMYAVSLSAPVVTVTDEGADYVTFSWQAVPLAQSYLVSIDNGATWEDPSSGSAGLTHTVTGLTPDQSVTIIVKAELGTACASENSAPVTGMARSTEVYIPNSFTPNGDGLNDVLQVYGNSVQSLRFMVFNQWGEKLVESTNANNVWDGKYRGTMQPSGVYIYVAQIKLRDGTVVNKKGAVNLIR